MANHNSPLEEKAAVPGWLRRTPDGIMEVISREGTTAQIDPFRFCQWMAKELQRRGVNVHQPARAREIIKNEDDVLCGVKLQKGEGDEAISQCKILF